VTLRAPDGGAGYYSQFSSPLSTDPSYFPIGAWFRNGETASIPKYQDFGMNLFVGVENPEGVDEAAIRASGMRTLVQIDERTRFNNLGSEVAGWLLDDEVDMQCGPPGCDGYSVMQADNAAAPSDGKARYANYGKGVMFWESDAQAEPFINDFQQYQSNDLYWMTDPNEKGTPGYGMPSAYGKTVDRMRFLDGMDGVRKPIWNFVETGWPWTEDPSTQPHGRILPAELRAAVWHSIIAGARGILYFDHQFNGTCTNSVILGQCYSDTRAVAKAVNAQVTALGSVLNSPFADGYASASSGVRVMSKRTSAGDFYVFAGSTQTASQQATIAVKSGTTADVVGENRTVPITNGVISDAFADRNAIHIYKIN
jgi:hypothetical protein